MENNNGFTYSYSAEKKNEAETIRRKYLPREETPLERLKSLDARVGRAGVIDSLVMGVKSIRILTDKFTQNKTYSPTRAEICAR